MQEQEKREEFRNILFELASNENLLETEAARIDMYVRFETLYCSGKDTEHFRHFYSDIFEVLYLLKQDTKFGTVEILGQNMGILYKNYEPSSPDRDISKEFKKLYDHISLDIARMSYSDAGDYRISGKQIVQELQNKVEALTTEIEEAHKIQEQMKRELNNQQREYVAILGIGTVTNFVFLRCRTLKNTDPAIPFTQKI